MFKHLLGSYCVVASIDVEGPGSTLFPFCGVCVQLGTSWCGCAQSWLLVLLCFVSIFSHPKQLGECLRGLSVPPCQLHCLGGAAFTSCASDFP